LLITIPTEIQNLKVRITKSKKEDPI